MSIELVLYLIDLLGNLSKSIWVINIVLIGLSAGMFFISINDWSENSDVEWTDTIFNKIRKYFLIIPVSMFLTCFIPSEKTMYMMIGANVIKSSTIPSKVEEVINKKLDEYLTEEKKDK